MTERERPRVSPGPSPSRAPGGELGVFGRRLRLGTILGFEVGVDASWIFIAALLTWSLAAGFFPARFPDLAAATYWAMGIAGTLGLFLSVVLHELSHSLVARRHGVEMRGITLFLFGGVAQMGSEPETPRAEFRIAIAGPIASVIIGGLFFLLGQGSAAASAPTPVTGVLSYLGLINMVLAVFNLVPAFPLDGGRVLRAVLWHLKGDLRWATRVAAQMGSGFGMVLIVLGVMSLISGNVIAGMWWMLIGMFLRGAARRSYQQLMVRRALEGEPVSRFMCVDPTTVSPDISLSSLVEDYFYRDFHTFYPVVGAGGLVGGVSLKQVKGIPRDRWADSTVGDLAEPLSESNTIQPDSEAVEALSSMQKTGISRLMVLEGDRLVGIVTLKDLLRFLALRIELEEG
ncbi:MAG: site-2 protease family protein [Gemmatimonadales bacterium]